MLKLLTYGLQHFSYFTILQVTQKNIQYLHKRFLGLGGRSGKGLIDLKRNPPALTDEPSCDNIFDSGFKTTSGKKLDFKNFLDLFRKFIPYEGKWKGKKNGKFKPFTKEEKLKWVYTIICDQAGSNNKKLTAVQLRSLFKDFLDPGYVAQHPKSLVQAAKEVIEEVATKKNAHYITEKEFIAYVETVMGNYDEVLQIHLDSLSSGAKTM